MKLTLGKVGESNGWCLKRRVKIEANPPIGPVMYPVIDWARISHIAHSAVDGNGLRSAHQKWCEGVQAELAARFFLDPADADGRGQPGETKWETIRGPKCKEWARVPNKLGEWRSITADVRGWASVVARFTREPTAARGLQAKQLAHKVRKKMAIKGECPEGWSDAVAPILNNWAISVAQLNIVGAIVAKLSSSVEREYANLRKEGWLTWVRQASCGHARAAYKFLKTTPVVIFDPDDGKRATQIQALADQRTAKSVQAILECWELPRGPQLPRGPTIMGATIVQTNC